MRLTNEQITAYRERGYVAPLPALDSMVLHELREAVGQHLSGATKAERYELTDDVKVRDTSPGTDRADYEYFDEAADPDLRELPFLFNLWKVDERFWNVANDPTITQYARDLLGVRDLLLFEDNVVVKLPGAKYVPWHQDYSYWPLGEARAVTVWIALDDVGPDNGAMEVAPGTQMLGERLPVKFLDGSPFMAEERRPVPPVPEDPRRLGYEVVTYDLKAGECGVHDALVWHGSTENHSKRARCALVLRYVAQGTTWLGSSRIPYDDIGCEIGGSLTPDHFPAVGGEYSSER